jgi:hypothetical protein
MTTPDFSHLDCDSIRHCSYVKIQSMSHDVPVSISSVSFSFTEFTDTAVLLTHWAFASCDHQLTDVNRNILTPPGPVHFRLSHLSVRCFTNGKPIGYGNVCFTDMYILSPKIPISEALYLNPYFRFTNYVLKTLTYAFKTPTYSL